MVTSMSEPSPQRHRYGSDPSQFADLYLPARRRRSGTVALLHGGWWGPRFGAGNLDGVGAGQPARTRACSKSTEATSRWPTPPRRRGR